MAKAEIYLKYHVVKIIVECSVNNPYTTHFHLEAAVPPHLVSANPSTMYFQCTESESSAL